MTRSAKIGPWATAGSVLSAVASSACCWLPLLLVAFGASAIGVATFFERYRPIFLVAAALLLGVGFYLHYIRTGRCAEGSTCEVPSRRLRRFNRAMLWIAAAAVLAFALFPRYAGLFATAPNPPAKSAGRAAPRVVGLAVEGMTCGGCATVIEQALVRVPGVLRAEVSHEEARALVELDPSDPPAADALIEAIVRAGYGAKVMNETAP